eukprot:2567354-Prymnesium_polylepis.1
MCGSASRVGSTTTCRTNPPPRRRPSCRPPRRPPRRPPKRWPRRPSKRWPRCRPRHRAAWTTPRHLTGRRLPSRHPSSALTSRSHTTPASPSTRAGSRASHCCSRAACPSSSAATASARCSRRASCCASTTAGSGRYDRSSTPSASHSSARRSSQAAHSTCRGTATARW